MKCWRDLSLDYAGSECPMWMAGFEVPELDEGSGIGLNESKCALVMKEKIAVYQGLIDLVEIIEALKERSDDELFRILDDAFDEPPRKKSSGREDPSQNRLILFDESKPAKTPKASQEKPRQNRECFRSGVGSGNWVSQEWFIG